VTAELLDPLRHNTWATKQLLEFCSRLKREQLDATSEGTYGTILATLQHIVGADARYRWRLSGIESAWSQDPEETTDLAMLTTMNDELGVFWEQLASEPFDPDRTITGKDRAGNAFEVKAGLIVAQALNHGNEHRAQIFTVLTTVGVEPPSLDGWSYGAATGRFVIST